VSAPVVWKRLRPTLSLATVCGLPAAVAHESCEYDDAPAAGLTWSARVVLDEWVCKSWHPTESAARAACERLAASIGGER
jgi:hypothetical protein